MARKKLDPRHWNTIMGTLPRNALIQFPSGRWGFAGSVDARLAFAQRDGSEPTAKQLQIAREHGPALSGLRTRSWPTEAEARAALASLGAS